jgi:Ca2+-transporting ATPase
MNAGDQTVPWHNLSIGDVFKRLETSEKGLSTEEARKRLSATGSNIILHRKPVSPLRIFLRQFASFFVLALIFAAVLALAVSFLPGESSRRLTSFFILGIVLLTVLLSFYEEYRAQKEVESLKDLLETQAIAIRDGTRRKIPARELVGGDVLVLTHGQKVPADARLIESTGLRADESTLTGESIPVDKSTVPVPRDAPLAEQSCLVFSATFLTNGSGLAVVVETGVHTQIGKIASTLGRMPERPTPFQIEVRAMARQMIFAVGLLSAIVAVILLVLLHEPPVDVALNALSLAVATIPESLPIVLAFALALGAHQMASRKAVVKNLSVVESLGSVDLICTDKTGTLTQGVPAIQRLYAEDTLFSPPLARPIDDALVELLRAGVLCNESVLEDQPAHAAQGDPIDNAILLFALSAGLEVNAERADYPKIEEIQFSSDRMMMTTVHSHAGRQVSYTKGAPGPVLSRCATISKGGDTLPMDSDQLGKIRKAVEQLESDGLYVLAMARKEIDSTNSKAAEQDICFLGLQAMLDAPRPEVASAIARAQSAGIRVVMITGDSALTAIAIGRQIGIGGRYVEAKILGTLPQSALVEKMKELDIVARAAPQTKQRVLQALQDSGHFVAMTGDGVNDTIALRQSDVGVAMGLRGTDIAKESSDMVLLDDNFATIVAAVEEGRRIFDNIRKFTNYLLSTSLGEVIVVLALSISGYFPLSAKMLLWVNVVTDLIPASALAGDPAVPEVMKRRPRRFNEPILNRAIYVTIAGSVLRTLLAYGFIFWAGLRLGDVTYARTMLFTSIVLHAFTRVMVVRQMDDLSWKSNLTLLGSYLAAVGLQLLALYTPLRNLFGIVALDARAWVVMVPVVVLSSIAGIYMTRWILKVFPLWEP